MFRLEYHSKVVKEDIPGLPVKIKKRIQAAIEDKLITKPEVFGKPLRRSLRGYRSLRVGDYRVIYRIEENVVRIILIRHRADVYEKSTHRCD